MQRKNYLLRKRGGFAMIMAIGVIVIISTIMALSLAMTAETTKKTTDLYLYEQAVLLSQSAAEYALLRISQDNNAISPCNVTSLIFTQDTIYDINITMKYIYIAPSPCATASDDYFTITTPEQNGSVLMDITVSVPLDKNVSTEPITYFRRSIQKL
jgi:type II secretory pathway pseudopilin PulG